jgi:4-carboxymuconolactone decarboxylase
MNSEAHERGLKALTEITGTAGAQVMEGLKVSSPELARWITDFCYGEVLSRPQLDLRSRQIATVAALTALGTANGPLKVHLHAALNVGVTPRELMEVILQMAIYAGFPASLNGLALIREVLTERGLDVD